jgi:hypothetical protein
MQPTYLPWSGYFNLISDVDVFVFLDDVQFEHQSWQTRNRILVQGKPHFLVAPVRKAPLATPISQVQLATDGHWRTKHQRTLQAAYGRHPFARDLFDVVFPILQDESNNGLASLNRTVIEAFSRNLGLDTEFRLASDLRCGGSRSEHLLEICETLGCTDYLSPIGSREYLEEDGFALNPDVRLHFQEFAPSTYAQYGATTFVSHLSLVDVVAHMGWRASRSYVTK